MGKPVRSGAQAAPLVSTAGKDHLVFSKKLLIAIALIFVITGFLFFSIEQRRIAGNLTKSKAAMAQNAEIKVNNEKLLRAKAELQEEEDALVNLYSSWLDRDSTELELSQEELSKLKKQLQEVTDRIGSHSDSLSDKEDALAEKEKRLTEYQFKIQQKQKYIEELGVILTGLNQTVPQKGIQLDETVDDVVWDDEIEGDDDFYDEFYTGDDDWMGDDGW
eukprot:m.353872 g.353872  ORF g.353872 m.353872 type:complete len:219 (-) comp16849_c0_seq1:255-911(-)